MRLAATAGLALLLAVGCGSDADSNARSGSGTTSRDSAGITIVEGEGRGTSGLPRWRPADAADLVIGRLEGRPEEQLYRVNDAVLLSDGRIAVANAGSSEVRIFAPDGSFLATIGGEGDGPGEFRLIADLFVLPGDTIVAWDLIASRATVLDPAGEFVRAVPIEATGGGARALLEGVFDDGTMLVGLRERDDFTPGAVSETITTYVTWTESGPLPDTVVVLPNSPTLFSEVEMSDGQQVIMTSQVPFAPAGALIVTDDAVHATRQESYEVRTYDGKGELRRILRRHVARRPLDAELMDRLRRSMSERGGDAKLRETALRAIDDMPLPDSIPPLRDLRVDDDGNLWIGRTRLPGDSTRTFDVYGADGRPVATATVPDRLDILHLGAGVLLAGREDELGVEQVALYPLVGGDDSFEQGE